MEKLKNLEYNDFIELVDYLNSLSDGAAIALIGKFFPNLTAVQELELNQVMESRDEDDYNLFKNEYPEMEIDPKGKSEPIKKNYWEIKLKALEESYKMAFDVLSKNNFIDKSKNKVNTQVFNAKTLSGMKNLQIINNKAYLLKRKLFIDKYNTEYISMKEFINTEKILESLGLKYNIILSAMIDWIGKKKIGEISYFVEHFFSRIEVLHDDINMSSHINVEFLDNLKYIENKPNN